MSARKMLLPFLLFVFCVAGILAAFGSGRNCDEQKPATVEEAI